MSKKRKYSALLLRTVSTSLVVMTTSRNWLRISAKDTKVSNCWALKIYSEWDKACRTTPNHTKMRLLTDKRDALCKELCKFVVENPVSTVGHPANSVWTAAIHQTGVATNAS